MNDAMNQNNTFGPTRPEYRGIQADEETGAYFNPSYLEVPTIDNLVEFEKEIYVSNLRWTFDLIIPIVPHI